MSDRPEKLCMIPWVGFSNNPSGLAQPCCLFKGHITTNRGNNMYVQEHSVKDIFTSKYMKDLRQQFRNGEQPAGCSTCWTDENNGYTSKRTLYNSQVYPMLGADVDWQDEPEYPAEYQMIISNSCNLKCRSCSPSHSTLWQQELKKYTGSTQFEMPHKQAGDENGMLWKTRHDWYKNLRRIEVVGGEPMYIKQWHKIFDELIETGRSKEIALDMSTNCNIILPELVQKWIDNFERVGIGLSVDGIGPTYNYMRHPGNWDVVYNNMKTYNQILHRNAPYAPDKKFFFQISFTLSWVNALDLTRMHDLLKSDFPTSKIWNNLVHYPEWMSLKNAPEKLKGYLYSIWSQYDWGDYQSDIDSIINFMFSNKVSDEQFKEYFKKNEIIDSRREEKLFDVVPEYRILLSEFVNEEFNQSYTQDYSDNYTE
jgi:MoaA/NifB/PqqE/SkfB family radical SAM enzyme